MFIRTNLREIVIQTQQYYFVEMEKKVSLQTINKLTKVKPLACLSDMKRKKLQQNR